METSLQENILNHIFTLELFSRLGMSLFFGMSVFGFACVLQGQIKSKRFYDIVFNVSRFSFLMGTISILVYGILQFILPIGSLPNQFYTGCSFAFALGLLILEPTKKEIPVLYFIIGSIIFLLMTLISFLEPKILMPVEQNHWFLLVHIFFSIISECLFVISFSASLLFIIKHSKLKKKKLVSSSNTTSLSGLEKGIIRSSFLGLAFITLALLSGLILVFVSKQSSPVGFLKIGWAFFVWGWFAITILGRHFFGWKGRKGAWLIVFGSIIMMLGFLGYYK